MFEKSVFKSGVLLAALVLSVLLHGTGAHAKDSLFGWSLGSQKQAPSTKSPVSNTGVNSSSSNWNFTLPGMTPADEMSQDLDIVWDWTKDELQDLYITGMSKKESKRLPYFDNRGPAALDLNLGGGMRDIEPVDGWVLLVKDFGTKESSVEMPFFILYNKYRGILRFFFYNTLISEYYQYGIVRMERQGYNGAAAVFTNGRSDYFLDDFDPDTSEEAIAQLTHLQWCYADFAIIGYDDDIPTNASLSFSISGVEEPEIDLDGTLRLEQAVQNANLSGSSKPTPGSLLKNFITGYNKYRSTADAMEDFSTAVKKKGGAVEDALRPILDSPFADAIPYFSAASGFLKAFIGGKPNQVIPMKFRGSAQFHGTIRTVNALNVVIMRIPGAPLSDPNDSYKPVYNKPLGLFNLATQPTIVDDIEMSCWRLGVAGDVVCDQSIEYYFEEKPEVVINPHVSADIEFRAGMICDGISAEMADEDHVLGLTCSEHVRPWDTVKSFDEMTLELVVTPYAGTYDEPILIGNTFEVAHKNRTTLVP